MTRIVLDIPSYQDIPLLVALCQRLGIRIVQKSDDLHSSVPIGQHESTEALLPENWESIVKPIRQSQSIEDMIREQQYQGFDRKSFNRIIDALDIQDPDGELLKLLRA